MSDGFLGRWSRRKQAVQAGQPVPEPPAPRPAASVASAAAGPVPAPVAALGATQADRDEPSGQAAATPAPPPPSLEDAQVLTPQSDFRPFMARDVAPEVKNAAMKKLFADPHFNVMDGLDIYIDDYTQPDPLPAAMLRQMTSAQFLNLVTPQPEPAAQVGQADSPVAPALTMSGDATIAATAPQANSVAAASTADTSPEYHDHTDLRLQQDHAPGAPHAGGGAG